MAVDKADLVMVEDVDAAVAARLRLHPPLGTPTLIATSMTPCPLRRALRSLT
jgi:hypothetical protein